MAEKYLSWGTNAIQEKEAIVQSAGASDAGKIPGLNADGKIDETLMPEGVSAETFVAPASENLAGDDVVNFWDDGGTLKCRKADASNTTKPAHGYVKEAITEGNNATVYTDGFLSGTGLTIGSKYFLAASPGQVTPTAPSTTGNIVQAVGVAVSVNKIKFEPVTVYVVRA